MPPLTASAVCRTPPFRRKMLSAASLDAAVCLTKTVYIALEYNLLQLSVSVDNSIQSRFLRISEENFYPALTGDHLRKFRESR